MDRACMFDLARIDPMYNVRQFVKEAKMHANSQNKNNIFCPCVDRENKIAWSDSKVVQSHLIKRGFKRNYTIWRKHGEIDDTLHELDTGVGDNNSDGVFDGDDHDVADDDDFDYQELLHHVEPQVLSSMGTQRGLSNMDILEKSSKDLLYDELNGCGKEFTQLRVMLELLKLKAIIGPESVDDETNTDKEDKTKRKILALVMWYLPVIDRLKRVFSNPRDAELVHWHSEKHREND
jgi:hypothetical protein